MKKTLLFITTFLLSTSLFAQGPTFQFTGYKFTEKTGVSGTFTDIKWNYKKSDDLNKLFSGVKVTVDTHSIDAGKTARNVNIKGSLFKGWGHRYVTLISKNHDEKNKTLNMTLIIGEKTSTLPFKYEKVGDKLVLTGTLDLLNIGYDNAFTALGKMCAAFHKGKDGKTKTWNTVDLKVTL